MPKLTLETARQQTTFAPGEAVDGLAGWEFDDDPPKWMEVRLYWRTLGKGDEDLSVVQAQRFEGPAQVDAQTFHFTLPAGPLSYEGRLIEVRWGLELVGRRLKDTAQVDLVVGADGQPVRI